MYSYWQDYQIGEAITSMMQDGYRRSNEANAPGTAVEAEMEAFPLLTPPYLVLPRYLYYM